MNHIDFRADFIPNVKFPPRDWSILEDVIRRNLSRPPKVVFRIVGWVVYCAQKWVDIVRLKRMKVTLSRKARCIHPVNFCGCTTKFLEARTHDRPFNPEYSPERADDRFLQVSNQTDELLTRVGLLVCSVLCADVSLPPRPVMLCMVGRSGGPVMSSRVSMSYVNLSQSHL